MIDLTREPGRNELRWFGLLLLVVAAILGSVIHWQFGGRTAAYSIWSVGVVVAAAYYAVPPLRMPIYLSWMYLTYPIGWFVSHAVLVLIFFGVITPIGLIMRALGRDTLDRRAESEAEPESYWVEHDPHRDLQGYFRRF